MINLDFFQNQPKWTKRIQQQQIVANQRVFLNFYGQFFTFKISLWFICFENPLFPLVLFKMQIKQSPRSWNVPKRNGHHIQWSVEVNLNRTWSLRTRYLEINPNKKEITSLFHVSNFLKDEIPFQSVLWKTKSKDFIAINSFHLHSKQTVFSYVLFFFKILSSDF